MGTEATTIKFNLGRMVITKGALAKIEDIVSKKYPKTCSASILTETLTAVEIAKLRNKHLNLEQGELGNEDYQQNLDAVKRDDEGHLRQRIFSAYKINNVKFWVITEWDESVTTILLPEDY